MTWMHFQNISLFSPDYIHVHVLVYMRLQPGGVARSHQDWPTTNCEYQCMASSIEAHIRPIKLEAVVLNCQVC